MGGSSDMAMLWFLIAGTLFVLMALAGTLLKRLPLSTSIVYLTAGYSIGPNGLNLLRLDSVTHASLVEHLTEVAVLISLFTAGLKLRAKIRDKSWRGAVQLATLGMTITVGLIFLTGWLALGFSMGAAVLLGAILAPTDPVLASGVQAQDPHDRDRLRFSLTGEAGLNDGTAFPFVMLGLGLLGLHELGQGGWKWVAVDLVWATAAGLGIGAALGLAVSRLVIYLRKTHREALGSDDFLALGLIALSYGAALSVHAYGFLAVFAAGLALRREERLGSPSPSGSDGPENHPLITQPGLDEKREGVADPVTDPQRAPAYMAQKVLEFNEALERLAEAALVLIVGSMLSMKLVTWEAAGLILFVLVIVRPAASFPSLIGTSLTRKQRSLIAWFGIRGIGSLYYLHYALAHGMESPEADRLANLVLAVVAASIVLHGITVTPLMIRYGRKQKRAA